MMNTEVCIVGAGPAGATLANFLEKEKVPYVLIDKAEFPRDKICGDGITVDVLNVLKRIDPELLNKFADEGEMKESWGFCFHSTTGTELRYDFRANDLPFAPFYTSRRLDLDNFLIKNLKVRQGHLLLGAEVKAIERDTRGFRINVVRGEEEEVINSRILIGAEGEKPIVTRNLGEEHYREKQHLIGALRVYYKNVNGFHPNGHLEFFFDSKLLPGYFWAFPLSNNEANVGLGMVSSMISKKKANLRHLLHEIIESNPRLSEMFKEAEPMESPRGWGLPLITPKRQIAGKGYALIGDAAGMIEPFTGKGIGPGMMSARICSEHIVDALKTKNYDLQAYHDHMYRYYKSEIRVGYRLQKTLQHPLVLNTLFTAANFPLIKNWSHQKMYREWKKWL